MTRLWAKLTLAFMVVILLGNLMSALIILRFTTSSFEGYIAAGDRGLARQFQPLVEDSIKRFGWLEAKENLFNLESENRGIIRVSPEDSPQEGRMRMPGSGMGRTGHDGTGMINRLVIVGPRGRVLIDTDEDWVGKVLDEEILERGLPLVDDQGQTGYLLVNSMVSPMLTSLGESFLKQVQRAIITSLLIMMVFSLVVVILLTLNITAPLKRMGKVADTIAGGAFDTRTGIVRRDELGDLSRSIDNMAMALEQGEEGKRRFIADSAHELRTPVALIQGTLEMIIDGVYNTDPDRLEMLYRETELLTRLIGDMQELSGWDSGRSELLISAVSMDEVNREVLTAFAPRYEKLGVETVFETSSPQAVMGDLIRLKQVLINLYSNALDHLPEQGGILKIRIASGDEGLIFSLTNNGPPIPEGMTDRLFDRFYRVDGSRNRATGGSGLGLSIVKEIISAHGGKVRAKNVKDGVCFSFSLPI